MSKAYATILAPNPPSSSSLYHYHHYHHHKLLCKAFVSKTYATILAQHPQPLSLSSLFKVVKHFYRLLRLPTQTRKWVRWPPMGQMTSFSWYWLMDLAYVWCTLLTQHWTHTQIVIFMKWAFGYKVLSKYQYPQPLLLLLVLISPSSNTGLNIKYILIILL